MCAREMGKVAVAQTALGDSEQHPFCHLPIKPRPLSSKFPAHAELHAAAVSTAVSLSLFLSLSPSAPFRPLLEEGVELPLDLFKGVVAQVVHLSRLPALLPLGRGDHQGGGGGRRGRDI